MSIPTRFVQVGQALLDRFVIDERKFSLKFQTPELVSDRLLVRVIFFCKKRHSDRFGMPAKT